MKPHCKTLTATLILHFTFSILNSTFAVVFTAGLEFPTNCVLEGKIVVQCIDSNSVLIGEWTVPEAASTNGITATAADTNAVFVASSGVAESIAMYVDGVRIASAIGTNMTVRPGMHIGSFDPASGIADIDLRRMRRALGAWRPSVYGAFTNLYSGVTETVVFARSPRLRAAGRGFVSVDAQGLQRGDLEGSVVSAFIDADGNGRYTAGELFGCSRLFATNQIPGVAGPESNPGMPWLYVTNLYLSAYPEIALATNHPSMARFDLSAFLSNSTAVAVDRSLGRRMVYSDYLKIFIPAEFTEMGYAVATNGISAVPADLTAVRLRVVRDSFSGAGYVNSESTFKTVVLDRTIDVTRRPLFTEADLLAAGQLGLDWGTVATAFRNSAAGSGSLADLANVGYRVVVGSSEIGGPDDDTEILPFKFFDEFTPSSTQGPATPVAPVDGETVPERPTFRWTIGPLGLERENPTAFRLRVFKSDGTTLVYDSGILQAPPCDSQGVYSWTAPLYAGMVTARGQTLEADSEYLWSVSMLNSKFTTFLASESKKAFRFTSTSPGE